MKDAEVCIRCEEAIMIIGLPKEIKDNEYRVAVTPGGVRQLVDSGHEVLVQAGAGEGSGFSDEEYGWGGGRIVAEDNEVWTADLIVKVKEPQPSEYELMRPELTLFTYLHLAAEKELTLAMVEHSVTGIAYETVEEANGSLPLLTPMSEVAGRMAVQVGAQYLEKKNGSRCPRPGIYASFITALSPGLLRQNLNGSGGESGWRNDLCIDQFGATIQYQIRRDLPNGRAGLYACAPLA